MRIKEMLQILDSVALDNNLSTPYIVGGLPRDILFNRIEQVNDIDITTGEKDVFILADLFAQKVDGRVKELEDHKQVHKDGVVIDFSTNFIDPSLEKNDKMSNLEKEAYSRDFTINTLMLPLDFSTVIDLTGKGERDIVNKVLDCPIDCNISLESSPNRILRAFYYKTKFNLTFSSELSRAINKNLHLLRSINKRYSGEMINKIVRLDNNMLDELIEYGVIQKLPLTKYITKILLDRKKFLEVSR